MLTKNGSTRNDCQKNDYDQIYTLKCVLGALDGINVQYSFYRLALSVILVVLFELDESDHSVTIDIRIT